MKLQDTTTTIAQIGTSEESSFKMKTSRKAFQILSDLYSDKPLAIVRELGCNAADSMVVAGKGDQPFLIHIPNAIEPWLTIQDFGTGITHENIYNIYATYFESTKTETNSQIGCLGLGSKSPFCYSDNFLVTSITGGEKRIYNAYFNQNNTPTISLMSTEATTEESGLAVQIPIKSGDFGNFYIAIKKAFRFFDIKPIITGGDINWKEETPVFVGSGWSSYEKFNYGEAYAIMGGVTYPINSYHIDNKHRNFLNKGGLVIRFDIGELDFTPSRESLSYDEPTIKALNTKMEFITKDFQEQVFKQIADKETIFDALKAVNVISGKFSFLGDIVSEATILWKGMDISNPAVFLNKIGKNGVLTHSKVSHSKKKYRESMFIDLKAKWYYNDLTKGVVPRVRQYLRNNPDCPVSVFDKDAYDSMIQSGFDTSLFEPMSSMPKVVVTRGGNRNTTTTKSVFNIYTTGVWYHAAWEAHEFNPQNLPKYYIVKDSSSWCINLTFDNIKNITEKSELRSLAEYLKIDLKDIVMVAPRNEKYLQGLVKPLVDHVNSLKFDVSADDLATIQKFNVNRFESLKKHKDFNKLDAKHPIVVLTNEICNAYARVKKYDSILGRLKAKVGDGKSVELKTNCPVTELLISKLGSYGWEDDTIMTIAIYMKINS